MKIGAISFKSNIYNAIQPNAIVFAVSVFLSAVDDTWNISSLNNLPITLGTRNGNKQKS